MITRKQAAYTWNYGGSVLRLRVYYKDGVITNYYRYNERDSALFAQQIWEYEEGIVAIISYYIDGE